MERYAQADFELRKDYGFGGIAVGVKPIGEISRAFTLGPYAELLAEWMPTPTHAPAQHESKILARGELIRVTLNENSLERSLLTNLSIFPPIHIPVLRSPPEQKAGGLFGVWSPSVSREEGIVMDDLLNNSRHDVAQRLNDLIEMYDKDPDVGSLNFSSLKSVAKFFKQNSNLKPAIVADWDGTLAVEWRLPPVDPHSRDQTYGGILSLEFLPNGKIEYLGFAKPLVAGKRIEYDGVAGLDNIISKVTSFLQRMQ